MFTKSTDDSFVINKNIKPNKFISKNNHSKFLDKNIYWLLSLSVAISFLTTLAVIFFLTFESFHFFQKVSLIEFLTGTKWAPFFGEKSFGVLPLVAGTMKIVIGAILFALPLGLLVSIYLAEFASHRVRAIIKPVLEILVGIPTVVYGYFALTFITPSLQKFFPDVHIFNAFSAALVVGIMIFPMMTSLCDDAFKALPSSFREGGYALGANRFEVVFHILLPAIKSRIGAATILAVSRAIGETMAVTLAAGSTPNLSWNPFEGIQTMTAYIIQVTMGDVPHGGVEYLSAMAVAFLLFMLTFVMNFIGAKIIYKRSIEV
jgi:phosphate transport system permease protein